MTLAHSLHTWALTTTTGRSGTINQQKTPAEQSKQVESESVRSAGERPGAREDTARPLFRPRTSR
ncbi:hypothetical protein QC764_0005500 [Podospora pseudoanserina]|uniref:Uncharacterized protein n=1 Tax=Podospora pseudoanserina TaxID=2609844 RepID=A0ABR0IMH5_9PEZI|nr:hypothetical protein QC764_0005500 [Podospora pseudoanserina]